MLFYETVNTPTLELLKAIQQAKLFDNTRLVGGTSLALQIGHHISIDLDLFGKIDTKDVIGTLKKIGKVQQLNSSENILMLSVNGIKVDVVNYSYPW